MSVTNNPNNPGPIQFNPNRGDNNIEHQTKEDIRREHPHGIHHITHAAHNIKEIIKDSNTRFMDNRKIHHLEGHNPHALAKRAKERKEKTPGLRVW